MTTTSSNPTASNDLTGALAGRVKAVKKAASGSAPAAPRSEAAPLEGLTEAEAVRLAELETIVETSVATIGSALIEIRDSRLYRNTHKTFEDYVAGRFGFSRSWAYRQIDAAPVLALASPMGDITTERQARELLPLVDDLTAMREVIDAASIDGQRPTASRLRREVKKRTGDAPPDSNARRGELRVETLSEFIDFDLAEFLADPDVAKLRDEFGYAVIKLDHRPKQVETLIATDLAKAAAQRREAASKKREAAQKLIDEADLDDENAAILDAIDANIQPLFKAAKNAKAAARKKPSAKRSS